MDPITIVVEWGVRRRKEKKRKEKKRRDQIFFHAHPTDSVLFAKPRI
jgi:hypothetical protein